MNHPSSVSSRLDVVDAAGAPRTTAEFRWPAGVQAAAAISFDVDAESAILGDQPNAATRLSVMSHQAYGPRTGVPRLLQILRRHDLQATFFVPGHTADRFPDALRSIRDGGHEIGHHGYLHEPVFRASAEQEEEYLRRGLDALERIAGVRPAGYRAPWWETSYRTPGLLAAHGFTYDSSLMDADRPYLLATGSPATPTAEARGNGRAEGGRAATSENAVAAPGSVGGGASERSIVEIPIQWGLDDWEQYAFLPGLTGSGVIESPAKVLELWTLEFEAMVAEGGCFVLTMHPFLTGRASRAAALERLIEMMQQTEGLWIATLGEIARHTASLGLAPVTHTPPLA